jgi:hypothetical protein
MGCFILRRHFFSGDGSRRFLRVRRLLRHAACGSARRAVLALLPVLQASGE